MSDPAHMSAVERVQTPGKLPARPADGHKGTFGRVLVIGGNAQMIGAPILAGTAALRTGSGLVQAALPAAVLPAGLSITPELIGLALADGGPDDALLESARLADAVVIGPGLGQSRQAGAWLQMILSQIEKPAVVDADALNLLAAGGSWPAGARARMVLTPHPGEMGRLGRLFGQEHVPADEAGRMEMALRAARAFGQVVVLKGHRTVVTDGRRVYVNHTGDSTLAKAGSGDVLSGMMGSLLGQGMERFDAAALAVYLHGRAGEIAGRRLGARCALARDVIDAIPAAIGEWEKRV